MNRLGVCSDPKIGAIDFGLSYLRSNCSRGLGVPTGQALGVKALIKVTLVIRSQVCAAKLRVNTQDDVREVARKIPDVAIIVIPCSPPNTFHT